MTEQDDSTITARRQTLLLLSRREYSAHQIRLKLEAKGHSSSVIAQTLRQFQNEGLQSDTRFAESYIRYRQTKGFGPYRIEQELRQKGVAQSLIDQSLNASEIPWDEKIKQVRSKKFGLQPPSDIESRAKQIRFLEYRGFNQELIYWVMSQTEED